ncbi:hypothetical protein FHETE_5917 [Fusarium heterosporum]|uniref:Uncharacterized protein n=1 Tax=Fusarium heterosporum TaxID=42747 RepID=A0A8H5TDP6_FUSHE|nr:hypothetical protein FHETE_5917 [Fusarium heterosporum]
MPSKIIIALILSCALLGGYASVFTAYIHGFFDALKACVSTETRLSKFCPLDMSDPIFRKITGYESIDSLINLLLEFFSHGLRKDLYVKGIDLEALLAFVYLAAHFGGVWYLIALEGLRVGNRGTILGWTGTFGIVFQYVTVTVIAPIYLTLQLLLSPSTPQQALLVVDPSDLNSLPISTVISYVLPSIGLCLPLIFDISRESKFIAVALWQPFPLYQAAIQQVVRLAFSSGRGNDNDTAHTHIEQCSKALKRAYTFIATLIMGIHLSVMATILASSRGLVASVSGHHILALTSLTDPPTLALLDPPVSAMQSREIVVAFLRWDVYCACLSMTIWSGYQLYSAQKAPSLVRIIFKSAGWALLGGPVFPAVMLLWERDEMILNPLEFPTLSQKHE